MHYLGLLPVQAPYLKWFISFKKNSFIPQVNAYVTKFIQKAHLDLILLESENTCQLFLIFLATPVKTSVQPQYTKSIELLLIHHPWSRRKRVGEDIRKAINTVSKTVNGFINGKNRKRIMSMPTRSILRDKSDRQTGRTNYQSIRKGIVKFSRKSKEIHETSSKNQYKKRTRLTVGLRISEKLDTDFIQNHV